MLDSLLNFAPGLKRYITLGIGVVMFGLNQFGVTVPDWAVQLLALFGFNALAQASKNDK